MGKGNPPLWEELDDGTLLVKEVSFSTEGNYSCFVSNSHGEDDIVYIVKVKGEFKRIIS